MRQRSFLLIASCVAAALLILTWYWTKARKPEAVFNGKGISFWIHSLGNGTMDSFTMERTWPQLGSDAAPYLGKALKYKDNPLRRAYLRLWPHLPKVVKGRLPRPVNARAVRLNAVNALGFWKEAANSNARALIEALQDDDWMMRQNVAATLGVIGVDHPEAVPGLTAALYDSHPDVRGNAAASLGSFGSAAKMALPALIRALKDSDPDVSVHAASTIVKIAPEEASQSGALKTLLDSVSSTTGTVRCDAILALGRTQNDESLVVPVLTLILRDSDLGTRHCVLEALSSLGKQAHKAVPTLVVALRDPDRTTRQLAARALKSIDSTAAQKEGLE